MELVFLVLLIVLMVVALGSGYPVAFALPGSAILTIAAAALSGAIFAGDVDAYFAQGSALQWLNAGVTNFRGIYWEAERDTLIAIPLFIFMGIMLERSKIAEDLLVAMAQLFGPIPGGLGISVVFVGALLAATTGIVGATVVAMGLISLPVMLRNNYSRSLATGTIAASGTLGQIIPPSIVLIILADQLSSATDQANTLRKTAFKAATGEFQMPIQFDLTSTSAGDMFLGALLPGLVLVGLYIVYIFVLALVRPKVAPPVPYEGKYDSRFALRIFLALVPPLTLIFAVLGSILLGIATVNQAGALGAAGALIMSGYRLMEGKRGAYYPAVLAIVSIFAIMVLLEMFDINVKNIKGGEDVLAIVLAGIAVLGLVAALVWSGWRAYRIGDTLRWVMVETAKTTSLVFIILLGAAMLTAAFRAFGGEDLVREFLTGLPGGFIAKFVVVMAVIFILGFFLDFIEIAVVVVPIIAPILLADPSANVTAVWLGVMIGVNMQTSFLTPPFGFALFYLRGVAPSDVTTLQMYRGVIPFILLQLTGLAIAGIYPSLVNYLPNRVYLTSETAPPPKNPKLQLCLENYVFDIYDREGNALRAAIDKAARLDISYLPDNRQTTLKESIAAARATFDYVEKIRAAEAKRAEYEPTYRPLHLEVRNIQKDMRKIDAELRELSKEYNRISRGENGDEKELKALQAEMEALKNEKATLAAGIPDNWEDAHKKYVSLDKAEKKARMRYRRNVDDAYEPLAEFLKVVGDAEALAALRSRIESLAPVVASEPPDKVMAAIKAVEKEIGAVAGAGTVKSKVSKVRRLFKKPNPDREKAAALLAKALEVFDAEVAWRTRAAKELAPALREYELAIRNSIGLRSQERLTGDQADEIASCLSVHRDISLSF